MANAVRTQARGVKIFARKWDMGFSERWSELSIVYGGPGGPFLLEDPMFVGNRDPSRNNWAVFLSGTDWMVGPVFAVR